MGYGKTKAVNLTPVFLKLENVLKDKSNLHFPTSKGFCFLATKYLRLHLVEETSVYTPTQFYS